MTLEALLASLVNETSNTVYATASQCHSVTAWWVKKRMGRMGAMRNMRAMGMTAN